MAIILQKKLFRWKEIEDLGDLERFYLVLKYLPDEKLMRVMEEERDKGRDDYPVRAVWNSILAGVVYEHQSVQSLRRELKRNGQLRELCGFDVEKGIKAVPRSWVYSRFLKNLMKHEEEIEVMFDELVEKLKEELTDYGKYLVVDGKAINTHANGKKKAREEGRKESDGRRDMDADWGTKVYRGVREDGTAWEKVKSWFGYKLHLVADATYELPISFCVTKASAAETPMAHTLFEKIKEDHAEILDRCKYGIADRGYDDGKLIEKLWDEYRIKPVIDIRDMWKDGEETKALKSVWNVVYNYRGEVFCDNPNGDEQWEMAYGGFEKERGTLKYRCPAKHYGYECRGERWCPVGKAVRISLNEDRRVFTPLARSSYQWKNIYKKRTAVERVNSRLDVSFGFEQHYIRGLRKMKLRCSLALCIMLAMALGRVKEKQKGLMRSLVKAA
ncbi:MAG: transposase [Spirochaetes bacterium DG_61]|jgi:transposase|nr:MAG: transposase [Spirochaetes bacterium DG_61]